MAECPVDTESCAQYHEAISKVKKVAPVVIVYPIVPKVESLMRCVFQALSSRIRAKFRVVWICVHFVHSFMMLKRCES